MSAIKIHAFYDEATHTYSYLLMDPASRQAAIIDSVLDFDPKSGRTATASAEKIVALAKDWQADIVWLLETHVHADHLSAAPYLKAQLGGSVAIGAKVTEVQAVFSGIFNAGERFDPDGRQFDRLLRSGDSLPLGAFEINVMATPGHTPACITYIVNDDEGAHAFVGDTLFMPDYGTARCDFPGGDAGTLYDSIQSIFALGPDARLYLCHDYPPSTRNAKYLCTVAEQYAGNIHIHEGVNRDAFIAMRNTRDAGLSMPVLLLPSVQVNMRAGQLPEPESNGIRYLKLPLNAL